VELWTFYYLDSDIQELAEEDAEEQAVGRWNG